MESMEGKQVRGGPLNLRMEGKKKPFLGCGRREVAAASPITSETNDCEATGVKRKKRAQGQWGKIQRKREKKKKSATKRSNETNEQRKLHVNILPQETSISRRPSQGGRLKRGQEGGKS